MKTLTKIIILLAAVVLAVGGIIIYAETRANSPTSPKEINAYTQNLKQCEESIKNSPKKTSAQSAADTVFDMTIDRIAVFAKENKIQDYDVNDHLDFAFANYMPIYLDYCFGRFRQSEWYKSELTEIQARNNQLRDIKRVDGSAAISEANRDSLSVIDKTITAYNNARAISANPTFTTVAAARSQINNANAYLNDKYLSNCTSLVSALRTVPEKISREHYKYVKDLVDKLDVYKTCFRSTYTEKYLNPADEAVNGYKEISSLYGSQALPISQQVIQLGTAKRESEAYYRTHSYLNK